LAGAEPAAQRPDPYSNAGDTPWQMVVLSGTQRIRTAISEGDAAIC
jgi:hypothetical protein